MTLIEFRREYPEYDDVPDGALHRLLKAAGKEAEFTEDEGTGLKMLLRLLQDTRRDPDVVSELRALADLIRGIDLKEVIAAVKGLKLTVPAPVVNVPAPVVNVPAPIVNVPSPIVNVPVPVVNVEGAVPKEWTFTPIRDDNGFIRSVKATWRE
jgi:hypothetical protein